MIEEVTRRALAILLIIVSCSVVAQESTTTAADDESTPASTTSTMVLESDSRNTREQLRQVLDRLPPQVGKVLKLDPALWRNEAYLASYPALKAFVAAHPEVAHSPGYFLESVWIPSDPMPETPSIRMWNQLLEVVSVLLGFTLLAAVLTWLIKTFVEQRKWSRLSKVQAEVHNKLMDRFASNEDLLRYIQTPAGKRFLESAPIPLQSDARPISPPIGRILWSVQAGLVIIAGGLGLQFVSWQAHKDVAAGISALGSLAVAIGIGLVVSAGAAWMLSRKLGLMRENENAQSAASE